MGVARGSLQIDEGVIEVLSVTLKLITAVGNHPEEKQGFVFLRETFGKHLRGPLSDMPVPRVGVAVNCSYEEADLVNVVGL